MSQPVLRSTRTAKVRDLVNMKLNMKISHLISLSSNLLLHIHFIHSFVLLLYDNYSVIYVIFV